MEIRLLAQDGFSIAFWQFSWDFVKGDILGMFNDFHKHERFVWSLNSRFSVLVLKKGVDDMKDFRPICLVGSLYKLLAKLIANRLKKVMSKVISLA